MKIYKAKQSGFCLGVRRAIKIAKDAASLYPRVYIKGDLVHNEEVCREIEGRGIKKVANLNSIPPQAIFLIKAHGEPKKTYLEAKRKKLKIIDATCPMVKDIHKKVQELEKKGYRVVIIGDRNHEETKGIQGNINKGIIIETKDDLAKFKDKLKGKIGIVCQSTQDIENVSLIIGELSKLAKELTFINTICEPTTRRQKELNSLASRCEAVLVVGSKKSANTRRLYQLAKKINKNTFWVSNSSQIKKKIKKFPSVGVIGGASTPDKVLEEVIVNLYLTNRT